MPAIVKGLIESGLSLRPVSYRYRWCPSCQHEWPAKETSCPTCLRWLGDAPLERTEWQVTPTTEATGALKFHEAVGASALSLRIISGPPSADALAVLAATLHEAFAHLHAGTVSPVAGHGWLFWTLSGLRHAFLDGTELAERLKLALVQLDPGIFRSENIRWGIVVDQLVLPCNASGEPILPGPTAAAIFNFEPQGMLLASATVYEANKAWEEFVCIPHRRLDEIEIYSYRLLDHKRPSALDHATAADVSPFVGRETELALLDGCRSRSATGYIAVGLIANAGSGKSRLLREWMRRHRAVPMLYGCFSLFGGDIVSVAQQLAQLPPQRLNAGALRAAIVARIEEEHVESIIIDDLHWADAEAAAFIGQLLVHLAKKRILAVLVARPSGQALIEQLRPTSTVFLAPLPGNEALDLAGHLIESKSIAKIAAERSSGNPLFVEQFAAWANETGYDGGADAPKNLHQVIAARITYLGEHRLARLRQRATCGPPWERQSVGRELRHIEAEIGLWLDRLETGDYADRIETAHHLLALERVDFELFMVGSMAGVSRPRSGRLREAIDRLFTGSAPQILADLEARAQHVGPADSPNLYREGKRGGDNAKNRMQWSFAEKFYSLVIQFAEANQQKEIRESLTECQTRSSMNPDVAASGFRSRSSASPTLDLERHPAVDALQLPDTWIELGERYREARYFDRAAEAAHAINDCGLALWATQRAAPLAGT